MIKVLDNVYDLVTLNMEQRFSERVALRFYDKETDEVTVVHYKDYARDIRRAVSYFQSTIPDIKGKKICLLNKNSYEYAVNTFGIILAGGVLVLLNQHKSWDELSYELGLVDPAAILTDGDDYGTKEQLQAAYGSILRPMDGFRAYEPVAEMPRCIGHNDLMVLMFTSGTTGRSKGVMLSERNFFSVMRAHVQIGERMMEYKHDPELVVSQYTVLPMFHLGAFICLFSWAHGGWALNISGDIRNFYKEIRRMPSQVMAVVPVIMNSLHKDVMRGRKERLGELWVPICSSAMFDPQVMLDMATNGMFVVQTYGATETCGDGIINYAQDAKHIGAVGQGNDYLDYKLEPDGELCIRGDSIMLGYYKDPEATAAVIDKDGWFHTGDLARVDEDGYYYITGRKKNLIILDSGENVSPEELEGMLDEEGKLVVSNENSLLQTKYGLLLQKIFGEKQEVLQIMQTLHWDQEPYRSRKINHRRADGMLVQQTCCKRAFIRGAFMAAGSISDPNKSYHFEIVCHTLEQAQQLKELMEFFEAEPKIVERKERMVVYLKEGSQIVDLLNVMEAYVSLMNLENVRILKEMRNSVNRKVNCETANINKTVNAAVKQMEDIKRIRDTIGFDNIPEPLAEIAQARLDYPEATLKELGTYLDPPVGKSGVNHRLRKLAAIAENLI